MSAVLYRLLPLVIALAGCSRAEEKPDTSTKYTNLSVPFSARVPAGWSLEDTTYVVTWASTIFALARNHLAAGVTPDFPGDEWRTTGPSPTSQLQLAKRVPPGGVVVMFCLVQVGPPVDCNFRRDTVGSSLASVVDSLGMSFSKPFHLGFSKWGVTWRIEVLARNVTSDDSLAVRELLRSIVFEPVPVVSWGQAAQLAYQALPPEVQSGAPCKYFHVDVTQAEGIFEALFGRAGPPDVNHSLMRQWTANGAIVCMPTGRWRRSAHDLNEGDDTMATESSKSIDEYIVRFPADVQKILKQIRITIKKVAPGAEEAIKYGVPTFVLRENLVHFAAFKNHIGFYPTPSGIEAFKKELSLYKSAKGSVQFPLDEPMPLRLIERIVKFRVNQVKSTAPSKKKAR